MCRFACRASFSLSRCRLNNDPLLRECRPPLGRSEGVINMEDWGPQLSVGGASLLQMR
jgi:hypothetical protein